MTATEKREAIRLVEESDLSVRRALREIQIPRATFYRWYRRYREAGLEGLHPWPSAARRHWNRIPTAIRQHVVDLALAAPERTPRELAWQFTDREGHFLSESSVYRILKGLRPDHQPGVRHAHGRQIVSASDASAERALADGLHVSPRCQLGLVLPLDRAGRLLAVHPGVDAAHVDGRDGCDGHARPRPRRRRRRPRTGRPSATAAQRQRALRHLRAARDVSRHARAAAHAERAVSSDDAGQDRYHRSLKNVVKLDHYYTPWALKRAIARFVEDYNHRRYHESLQNVTPADVYEGRQAAILARRERIKQQPLQRRKRENLHTPHHAAMRSDVPLSNGTQLCHRV